MSEPSTTGGPTEKPAPATASHDIPAATPPALPAPQPTAPARSRRKNAVIAVVSTVGVLLACYFGVPLVLLAWNTVSTDDAYVNGHVTLVAARVGGQVARVLVDDNNRVKKGDLLLQLDREPYEVQVAFKDAALATARADVDVATAQVYAMVAKARSSRFKLEHAIEDVHNQIANLRASVENVNSKRANLDLSLANLKRGEELAPKGTISKEELDQRRQAAKADAAALELAHQQVYGIRVGLGTVAQPAKDKDLADVPPDLPQTFSTVRQAAAEMLQAVAPLGVRPSSFDLKPNQILAEFLKRDPEGNLDKVFATLVKTAPDLEQTWAKVTQAQRDLELAKLNLSYCDVRAEIDGVVTRRNVNPGNNVQAGQSLMAVRSLTEIWIDANFKETQLADLRIGQAVKIEVDMYGGRTEFAGRITGFTMGTGQTLALLPPQNATGNFVKIVQRLPVKIELNDYDESRHPLFVGLSVTPYVHIYKPLVGDDPGKGKALQPRSARPTK